MFKFAYICVPLNHTPTNIPLFPEIMSGTMTQSQIEALFEENPAIKNVKIRVDKKTQKASVIDVIKLVTGQNNDAASTIFKRLSNDVRTNCSKLRINGKGRETPVADAPTLVSLIWELPGKAARAFRRQSAHWVCRILGGDLRLGSLRTMIQFDFE